MVAIPVIWPGQRRIGLIDRLTAWIDATAETKPARTGRSGHAAPRRAAFLEDAAMSREMYRL